MGLRWPVIGIVLTLLATLSGAIVVPCCNNAGIAAAISASADGQTIALTPGTYSGAQCGFSLGGSGKSLVFEGNGATIVCGGAGFVLNQEAGADVLRNFTLVLNDSLVLSPVVPLVVGMNFTSSWPTLTSVSVVGFQRAIHVNNPPGPPTLALAGVFTTSGNRTVGNGGGVYVEQGDLNVAGSSSVGINGDMALSNGTCIYMVAGTLNVVDTVFRQNTGNYGVAIYTTGDVSLVRCSMSFHNSTNAAMLILGSLEIVDSNVTDNTGVSSSVLTLQGSTFTISNSLFTRNVQNGYYVSPPRPGMMYVQGACVTVSNSFFLNNVARGSVQAAHINIYYAPPAVITNTTMTANDLFSRSASLLYVLQTSLTLDNCIISHSVPYGQIFVMGFVSSANRLNFLNCRINSTGGGLFYGLQLNTYGSILGRILISNTTFVCSTAPCTTYASTQTDIVNSRLSSTFGSALFRLSSYLGQGGASTFENLTLTGYAMSITGDIVARVSNILSVGASGAPAFSFLAAQVYMDNCTVRAANNSAGTPGGAVWFTFPSSYGNFFYQRTNITRCIFEDNRAAFGGAIAASGFYQNFYPPDALLTVTDSIFANNSAVYSGGAFYFTPSHVVTPYGYLRATVLIERVSVAGAYAGRAGGILHNDGGRTTVIDSTFANGTTVSQGGGIYASSSGSVLLWNVEISGSEALNGGGLWTDIGHMLIASQLTLRRNSALSSGGAGVLGLATINDSLIEDNDSTTAGGIMVPTSGSVVLEGTRILRNYVAYNGAGVLVDTGSFIALYNSSISQNVNGGGITVFAATAVMDNVVVDENTVSAFSAGGLTCFGCTVTLSGGSRITRNLATTGTRGAGFGCGPVGVKTCKVDLGDTVFAGNIDTSYPGLEADLSQCGGCNVRTYAVAPAVLNATLEPTTGFMQGCVPVANGSCVYWCAAPYVNVAPAFTCDEMQASPVSPCIIPVPISTCPRLVGSSALNITQDPVARNGSVANVTCVDGNATLHGANQLVCVPPDWSPSQLPTCESPPVNQTITSGDAAANIVTVPSEPTTNSLLWPVVGAILGAAVLIILVLVAVSMVRRRRPKPLPLFSDPDATVKATGLTMAQLLQDMVANGAPIAEGGSATVYKAKYEGDVIALKLFKESATDAREDYHREVRAFTSFSSDRNLCASLLSLKFISSAPMAIGMEYVDGPSLYELVKNDARNLTEIRRFGILEQIAEALEYLEANHIAHLDLKTRNILVMKGNSVKLIDYGVSQVTNEVHSVRELTGFTPQYVAPEIAKLANASLVNAPLNDDSLRVDLHAADSFSFGTVLCTLLTLDEPFKGESGAEVYASLINDPDRRPAPPDERSHGHLLDLMQSCWHRDPHQRPSFGEISHVLQNCRDNCFEGVSKRRRDVSTKPRTRTDVAQELVPLTLTTPFSSQATSLDSNVVFDHTARTVSSAPGSVQGVPANNAQTVQLDTANPIFNAGRRSAATSSAVTVM